MHTTRILSALVAAAALMISCGGDDDAVPGTSTTSTVTVATTSAVVVPEQPAIWPAAEVKFETPEAAAADFVEQVLGVPPFLGEFVQGDSRSGEIEVFSPGESSPVGRGLLLLRQLGPGDGWFVIGATNPNATISTPQANAVVPAGPLTVEGVGRGFETTVVLTAFPAGDAGAVLDQVVTRGGAFETPEPYRETIDLTGASPGDVITLLVRGDTGLETDPGEFGAIPVVIVG